MCFGGLLRHCKNPWGALRHFIRLYTILYYAILNYIVLYNIILYSTVEFCAVFVLSPHQLKLQDLCKAHEADAVSNLKVLVSVLLSWCSSPVSVVLFLCSFAASIEVLRCSSEAPVAALRGLLK